MTSESILDHGYVQLIEKWGSDQGIVESARMSTGKGFKGWGGPHAECQGQGWYTVPDPATGDPAQEQCAGCEGTGQVVGDEKFLKFLWDNKHHSPFEQAGMTIEVQAPIFIFREWHRHRTQSYNEMSGRYTALPDLVYVPSIERLTNAMQGTKNKQGSEGGLSRAAAEVLQEEIVGTYTYARKSYEWMLENKVAREVARLVLPVGQYSRMRASANLRNWLGFLTLRMAPDAQWEIRQYAEAVGRLVAAYFPRTWELFQGAG